MIIHAQRRHRPALDRIGVGSHQRQLVFHRHFIKRFISRHHIIIERGINQIGFAFEAAGSCGHIGAALRRRGGHFDALLAQFHFQLLQHHGGIHFAGAIHITHRFERGHDFFHQIDLRRERQLVRHAGDIGFGGFPAAHQFGGHRVGNGGKHHRNRLGGGHHRLRARRGNGHNHIGLVAGKFLGNLAGGGGAALRALKIDLQILALFKALCFQFFQHALAHIVQRRMFHNGGNRHFFHISRSRCRLRCRRRGSFLFGRRAGGQKHGGQNGEGKFYRLLHDHGHLSFGVQPLWQMVLILGEKTGKCTS